MAEFSPPCGAEAGGGLDGGGGAEEQVERHEWRHDEDWTGTQGRGCDKNFLLCPEMGKEPVKLLKDGG